MITVEKIKKILKKEDMPDAEAERIRDEFRNLAEVIFEHSVNIKLIKRND